MMQVYVKEMPENKDECAFSVWKPFSPCCEPTGYYFCRLRQEPCSLQNETCFGLYKLNNININYE